MAGSTHRLPRSVVPHEYVLSLEPDLDAARFRGTVVIECTVDEPVREIVLNAAELSIDAARVDGRKVEAHTDEATQRLTLDAAHEVGPVVIELEFTGTLNDKLRGWYRSTFEDGQGQQRVIATTQMQSTDCRRAFPCFDEPDFKATFTVTLVVDAGMLAVSNGPETSRTTRDDGKHVVHFAPTMPISTYLVAFVVGPLEATAATIVPRLGGGEIEMRVVHVPGKAHLADFALEVGRHAMGWFQDYYGIAYPTEKCDLLALPDFAAGAMENLGCITFRESLLLVDPDNATQQELQVIADVVSHELAHMWFGDLVTMRWWNGIWLNEAFATFMEVACCAAFREEWKRWTTFSLERSAAFEVDSLASTRTVEFPVDAPEECEGMFDVLTYEKGGSLLRMLEQYLGEDRFRAGVSHYLRTHEYGNTETGDLWDAIEHVAGDVPVRKLMDSWIWQAGYPLIRAARDGDELVLSQQRFAFGPSDDPTLFVVPVQLRIDGVEQRVLLDEPTARLALAAGARQVVVNAGGNGFYRVGYDAALRDSLLAAGVGSLSVVERYNLVDDAWNEVVAGRLDGDEYLALVEGFSAEREVAVWQSIAAGLRGLWRVRRGAAERDLAQRTNALIAPALADLGLEAHPGEDSLTGKLRALLVTLGGTVGGDPALIERARAWLDGGTTDPELLAAATTLVASTGSDDEYARFVERAENAPTPQEQLRFLYALVEFPTAAQAERTAAYAFSDKVKTQNAPFLLNRLLANRDHGAIAWGAIRAHWADANERFPTNTIVRMVDSVKHLVRPEQVAEVRAFFAEHPIPQGAKTLEQILERQQVNAALAAREGRDG